MNEINTTEAIDELILPLRTEMTRRDLLKRVGAGSLAVASAAVLAPLGAEAAYPTSLSNVSLRIDKSGSDALIKVYYTLRLNAAARAEINSGIFKYRIWFRLLHSDTSLGSDWNYDDEYLHGWWSGTLSAKSPFVHSTSQTLRWSGVRSYGTTFYAHAQVFKRHAGVQDKVSARVSTRNVQI